MKAAHKGFLSLKYLTRLVPILLLSICLLWLSRESPAGASPGRKAASDAEVDGGVPALTEAMAKRFTPISWREVFVTPAGSRGLEYTEKSQLLSGCKIRIRGYMIRHAHRDPSIFLFSAEPKTLKMDEFGLADDLPPYAAHVILPVLPGMAPDWIPGALEVFGELEIGAREEMDSRISYVRIRAEHITPAGSLEGIEPRRSVLLQPARVLPGKIPFPSSP